jgi:hypothetical protein
VGTGVGAGGVVGTVVGDGEGVVGCVAGALEGAGAVGAGCAFG